MQHLLGISDLTTEQIQRVLDRAAAHVKSIEAGDDLHDILKNKIILTLFFESSTRTLTSFDIAAKRLGAQVVNWSAEHSSLSKNESFTDTIDTLSAMKPDALIIRHSEYGAPGFVASRVDCPVINAGDSWREHPTQAFLDALTMVQNKGKLNGLNVAICGDVAHSRVANSNAILLSKMGANVRLIAPDYLMPDKFPIQDVETFTSLEDGLPDADIVMMLRIQKERMQSSLIPDDVTYYNQYGLTAERLALAKPDALVFHPGPMNRNVEISDIVADDPTRSMMKHQVANGIPVRMAVLDLLINNEIPSSKEIT